MTDRPKLTTRTLPLAAALLLLSQPATTVAQSPKEQAQALLSQGNVHHAWGRYPEALKLYLKARALYPSYKIDLNIGGTLDAMKRHSEAAVYLESALKLAGDEVPPAALKVASQRLEVLRRSLSSVTVICLERGAGVEVDGETFGQIPLRTRVYLAPGNHLFVVRKPGFAANSHELNLIRGEHRRLVVVLAQQQAAAKAPAVPAPIQDDGAAGKRHAMTRWGYTALGVSLASAVTGGLLIGFGVAQGEQAHDAYWASASEVPPADLAALEAQRDEIHAARAMVATGAVLSGLALAAAGVSVYLLITRPEEVQARPARSGIAGVSLAPRPGGAALLLGGTF